MDLISELGRVKSKLDDKTHQSPHQLKIWRKRAAWLRRKIDEGFEREKENDRIMNQLSLKLRKA